MIMKTTFGGQEFAVLILSTYLVGTRQWLASGECTRRLGHVIVHYRPFVPLKRMYFLFASLSNTILSKYHEN